LQLGARQPAAAEQVPRLEDPADDPQAFLAHERTGTAPSHPFLEVALEMGPANLPVPHRPASVPAPAVGAEDAVEGVAQQRGQSTQRLRW
jgi:hypothetical protein